MGIDYRQCELQKVVSTRVTLGGLLGATGHHSDSDRPRTLGCCLLRALCPVCDATLVTLEQNYL